MKKICLLIPTLNSGGIEMYVLRFLRFCKEKEKKFDITVIVKNGEKGVLYDDYMAMEADVILLKTGYFNIYSWIKVYNLFKKVRFETICDFTGNSIESDPLRPIQSDPLKLRFKARSFL